MGLYLLYGAALFGVSVQALAFEAPQPTDPFQAFPQNGWSPKPTPGPDAHALLRRQNTLPEGYLLAPDNTCGFISANPRSAYACLGDGMTCVFAPSSGKVPGAAGCCSGSQCAFRLACVDNREMDDCDDDCQADAMTLKCTGAAKFCNTVAFPGGVSDYFCGSRRAVEYKAQTTNSDDTTRSMSTAKSTTSTTSTSKKTSTTTTTKSSSSSSSSSTKSSLTTKSSASSTTSSETSSSSTESSTAEASTTDASNTDPSATEIPAATSSVSTTSGTAVAGAAATASTTPATSDAPSTPVGGIVGGVVGGVAAIALIILGAFFLRRHKKKNDADAAAAVPPPVPFMTEPTIPPVATYAQPAASLRGSTYNSSAPHQSPASAPSARMYATPAPAAAAPVSAFSSYKNNDRSSSAHSGGAYYPEPSPLSTPSGSPRPQYQHQPHAPSPVVPPAYYQQHDRSSNPSGSWTGAEPLDRRSTTTPVSTYHGATPVTPASALGPMPGEQGTGGGGGGMPGVPLILQPGMGYRPYRPPSSATTGPGRPATAGSEAGNRARNDSVSELPAVGVAKAVSISRKPVARSTSGSKPQQAVPGPSQSSGVEAPAAGDRQGGEQGSAAELP